MDAYRTCPFGCGWTWDTADHVAPRGALCVHLTLEHGAHHGGAAPSHRLGRLTPFLVRYRGWLTEDDRLALDRPGFMPWHGDRVDVDGEHYCGVRVNAHSAEDAEAMVIEALGRRPDALIVS